MAEWDTALDGFQTMCAPLNFSPLPFQTLGDSNECRGLAHLCAITADAAPLVAVFDGWAWMQPEAVAFGNRFNRKGDYKMNTPGFTAEIVIHDGSLPGSRPGLRKILAGVYPAAMIQIDGEDFCEGSVDFWQGPYCYSSGPTGGGGTGFGSGSGRTTTCVGRCRSQCANSTRPNCYRNCISKC